MLQERLADDDVSESNVGLAWNPTANAGHEAKADRGKLGYHASSDRGGRLSSHLASGKTSRNNIVGTDASEGVDTAAGTKVRRLVFFVQHLLHSGELDREGANPSHGIVAGLTATAVHADADEVGQFELDYYNSTTPLSNLSFRQVMITLSQRDDLSLLGSNTKLMRRADKLDYTVSNLTVWGYNEFQRDCKALVGSMLRKFIQRGLSNWSPDNSVAVMQPMYTKKANESTSSDLKRPSKDSRLGDQL
ncbi:hypothetical protein LZ31DRAFT_598900 [Colletotrichum somersetense]|nr:hypothetical protein LZ31DRAFT_598900 [Colletotrichum somersetense]